MRLVALTDIAHSIGIIPSGSVFVCNDDRLTRLMLAMKQAKPEEVALEGWSGLRWRGFTVAILASGPSLSEEQCAMVKRWRESGDNRRVIAINTTYQRAPWADVLYACDGTWWYEYHDKLREAFAGELWTQDVQAAKKYKDLRLIPSAPGVGLSKKVGLIHQGGNGGYQAIGLAHQAGAKHIILLGFDMHDKGGKHWHGDHPRGLNKRLPFKDWIAKYDALAKDLTTEGVAVTNATPGSALKCFPMVTLEEQIE